jgi:hypothetical protein
LAFARPQATVPDVAMTEPIHDSLHAKDLLPGEHIVDAGYTSADRLGVDDRRRSGWCW